MDLAKLAHGDSVPEDKDSKRAWVKLKLAKKGLTFTSIAAAAGITKQAISSAFERSYPAAERVIATAIEMDPDTIWPERYEA